MREDIMNNKISIGNEVLVFNKNNSITDYKEAIVVSIEEIEYTNHHSNSEYISLYTIMDDNGKLYKATNSKDLYGSFYILTKQEYLSYLLYYINLNNNKIMDIKKENETLTRLYSEFTNSNTLKLKK